ncbi:MAG TPA: serine/threonine-protein kinase [Nannocystaceae bacterium]|nr:serine/threonine-protein kinase [Nannocystaceae bacterium]
MDTASDEHKRSYQRIIAELGIELEALAFDESGTIVASGHETLPNTPSKEPVPRIAVGQPRGLVTPDLVLDRRIAEGGRGEVWSATQTALARPVAVKRVRASQRSPLDDDALVREGRVLGSLEHPNIVPVHVLGKSGDGEPLVVMRLLDGTPWQSMIAPLFSAKRAPDDEQIEKHLRILVQVCHAIEFAHSRGVIHRDLKPDNVMVGRFGEIYVLDWGLAVGREENERLPAASSVRTLAGTPGYMAPEMAVCDGGRIDERTDVYLLGATLHELVTGCQRHEAATVVEQLALAHVSAPFDYGTQVPAELAAICNRATHLEPAQRYPDVAAFRAAVLDFLRHQSARQLAATADDTLRRLTAALQGESAGTVVAPASLSTLASEAKLGFQIALRAWPENPAAQAGLERALGLGVDLELRQGNARGAASLLAELRSPRPDLVTRLRALEADLMRKEGELQTLRKLRDDENLGITAARRRRASIALGSFLGGGILLLFTISRLGIHRTTWVDALVFMSIFSIVLLVYRRSRRSNTNAVGMRVLDMATFGSIAATASFGLAWITGIALEPAVSYALLVAGAAALVAMPSLGRSNPTAACFIGGAFGSALAPDYLGPIAAVACVGAFMGGAWATRDLSRG